MQLSDRGGQLTSRPTPNPTISPGWANNDLTQTTAPTIGDPDWGNAITAELLAFLTATGQTPSKANTSQVLTAVQALIAGASNPGGGVLTFVSGTQLNFRPASAGIIRIAGTLFQIPAGGLAIANTAVEVNGTPASNLAANTTYDLYLKNVSGTLTPSFFTDSGGGTHITDTTAGNIGTEVRSNSGTPDSTRTLIAKVATNGSNQFQATHGVGFINWLNRKNLAVSTSTGSFGSSNATLLELSTSLRLSILTWGDDAILNIAEGFFSCNASGSVSEVQSAADGTLSGSLVGVFVAATGQQVELSSANNLFLADGQHVISPFYSTGGGGISANFNQFYNRIFMRG